MQRKFAEQDNCLSHVCLPKYIDGSNDISELNPTHFRFMDLNWVGFCLGIFYEKFFFGKIARLPNVTAPLFCARIIFPRVKLILGSAEVEASASN